MEEKEYIKVDDLYKGRADKEESIPTGAWERMSHKLDNVPVPIHSNRNWRWGVISLLALFTIGGGISLKNNFQKNAEISSITNATENTNNQLNTLDNNKHQESSEQNNIKDIQTKVAQTPNKNSIAKTDKKYSEISDILEKDNSKNSKNKIKNGIIKSSKNKEADKTLAINEKIDKKGINKKNHSTNTKASIPNSTIAHKTINSDLNTLLEEIDQNKFTAVEKEDSNYIAVLKDNQSQQKFVLPKVEKEWKIEENQKVIEIERKVSYITNEEGKTSKHFDTLSKQSYSRVILKPLSQQQKVSLVMLASTEPEIALSHNTYNRNLEEAANSISKYSSSKSIVLENNLVPLSNYKVKENNNSKKQSLIVQFQDLMDNYFKGVKPYYFGSSIGVQAAFSYPEQYGFHFSLASFYDLNERSTIAVELKYLQNIFNNKPWKDSYNQFSQQTIDNSGTQPLYSAFQQTFSNLYTFKSASYIEMPVTFRYQINNLSIMSGAFASYMINTKYTAEQNKEEGNGKWVSGLQRFENTNPQISSNEFNNRLGLGFTVGALYDFSKNTSLDFRINQNVWNNKNQNTLSIYKSTGIQLSLFYFMGRKDKVIYMMNQK
ncbi:MAG TPA: hypothetical protein VLZ83_02330 [Edaphocola sp.]|nr:hypothetical protein [Edaphocola sp.]